MKKFVSLIFIVISCISLTNCEQISSSSGKLEIHIIDVGQGDSILLITPQGQSILIDTGSYQNYDKLKAYLLGIGVESFDKVIATHPDADHIGSMSELIDDFYINEFYMPDKEHTTASFDLMIKSLEKNDIPIINSFAGHDISLSEEIKGSFLSPYDQYYDENNLYSLVLYLEHGNNSFIFMGDAEKENEYDILADYPYIEADFIKLGHHGSSSSSSKDFITQIDPYIAAVSVGKDNSFGHPHESVVQTLESLSIPLYRTDEQGNLVFISDGHSIYSNHENSGSYNFGKK